MFFMLSEIELQIEFVQLNYGKRQFLDVVRVLSYITLGSVYLVK